MSVVATVTTSTQLRCVAPARSSEGAIAFSVSNNGQEFAASPLEFTYVSVSVSRLSPTLGPTAGSSTVTVTGSGFLSTATCLFGTAASTAATYQTANMLLCRSPVNGAGSVAVEVSNNGVQYSASRVPFYYYSTTCCCSCVCTSVLIATRFCLSVVASVASLSPSSGVTAQHASHSDRCGFIMTGSNMCKLAPPPQLQRLMLQPAR